MGKKKQEIRDETVAAFQKLMQSGNTMPDIFPGALNITFWCGAGFSKSWNRNAPTDGVLFSIEREIFLKFPNLCQVLNALGWQDNDRIGFEGFKTLSYVIDMQLKYPEIRNRFLDEGNLLLSLNEIRSFVQTHYHELCGKEAFDMAQKRFVLGPEHKLERIDTLTFFDHMINGERTENNDAKINFVTTNYDFTIEAILDNLDGRNAPALPTLYRGVTPRSVCGDDNWKPISSDYKHTLLKLNGGFEILRDWQTYHLEYGSRTPAEIRNSPPTLMLPNREQDYADPYFKEIFPKAIRLLRNTNILVIVGYSMPWEDILIRFVLQQLSEGEARGKWIICVDLKGIDTLKSHLQWTFGSIVKYDWPRVLYYPGSFTEFCRSCNTAS